MELEKISPYALKVWKITGAIASVVFLVLTLASYIILPMFIKKPLIVTIITIVLLFIVLISVVDTFFISKIRYNNYYFSVNEKMIKIKYGVFIKKVVYIPMSRVQHINTSRGPIMKKYDLRGITINTAGGTHSIPCIEGEKALFIQETIANFAEGSSEENGL